MQGFIGIREGLKCVHKGFEGILLKGVEGDLTYLRVSRILLEGLGDLYWYRALWSLHKVYYWCSGAHVPLVYTLALQP